MRYGAFISYSRSDAELAAALQDGVERFGKRWNQARTVKLFRDDASLSANAGLWSSIEAALAEASWLVLLASPSAAGSPWVEREVRWWLEHRSIDTLLIVLTRGELEWDTPGGDFDWARSTAVPRALAGPAREVPRYVDARWSQLPGVVSGVNPALNDAIVDIAATVRGIEKDELVGTAVREQKHTLRLARAARLGLATLFTAAVLAAVIAAIQANRATEQATTSLARQLAAKAETELPKNLDVAMLLAVRGHRTAANDQTRAALLRANTASPRLVRYTAMGATVSKVTATNDGRVAVAGLADGSVVSWVVADPHPRRVLKLSGAITGLAVSGDAKAVAASDGDRAALWRRGRPVLELRVPAAQTPDAVALSPSGRVLLVHGVGAQIGDAGTISVVRLPSAATSVHHTRLAATWLLAVYSDDEALALSLGGLWERRRISGWRLRSRGSVPLGVHRSVGAPSADGRFLTATNGATPIPIWPARPGDAEDPAPLDAQGPIRTEGLIALSSDGNRLAAVEGGVVHVMPVATAGTPREATVALDGNGGIADLAFLGDGSRVLAASRASVALWNLAQIDRLARVALSPLLPACNACDPPVLAMSPDGRRLAMLGDHADGSGRAALVQPLTDAGGRAPATKVEVGSGYGPPVWVEGGRRVLFAVTGPDESDGADAKPPAGVRAWRAGGTGVPVQAVAPGADARTVIVVDTHANIYLQDATTGRVRRKLRGPRSPQRDSATLQSAAIQSSAELVATLRPGALTVRGVRERKEHTVVGRLPAKNAVHVAYAGRRLLVEREDGSLEVWDARGRVRERVLPGDAGFVRPPVGDAAGKRVARRRENGAIELSNLDTGAVLGRFEAPPTDGPPDSGLAFSPDGRWLISASDSYADNGVLIIRREISDDGLVRGACAAAGRDLTAPEWRAFVGSDPPGDLACR